jgi:flagellar basal body-associated protein FliL
MADDKNDSAKTEDAVPVASATTGGGFKAWLPLITTIVLMPALAFGMTRFVLLPQLQKGLGIGAPDTSTEGKPNGKKAAADVKHESVIMAKLLVNVSGTMGARYLLVSLSVVGTSANFKAAMVEHDAQLRDMATGALQLKTLADLEKAGSRNLIRSELMNGFNNILGDASVSDIYFTEFAIQ